MFSIRVGSYGTTTRPGSGWWRPTARFDAISPGCEPILPSRPSSSAPSCGCLAGRRQRGWRLSTRSSVAASRVVESRRSSVRGPPGGPGCSSPARGALVALVDVADGLDPRSAAAAGVDLRRLLWVRLAGRLALAWPAADILVRGGGFDMIAVDVGDPPPWALGQVKSTAIVRLQRAVEGTPAVLLVVGPRGVAGSLATLVVALGRARPRWASHGPGLLLGLETEARLVRARDRAPGATARLVWGLEAPAVGGPIDQAAGDA